MEICMKQCPLTRKQTNKRRGQRNMRLQDYKKFITMAFVGNTRRGFADWRDCGSLCRDVVDSLEGAKDLLCAENRYEDLFKLCNWTYVKWGKTDKDDSNGETQDFCACIYEIWETIYNDGEKSLPHSKMLSILLEHLDGRVYDYMEDTIYDFVLNHFKNAEELDRKAQFLLEVMEDLKRQIPDNDVLKYSLYVKEDYYVRVMADQKRPIQEIRAFVNSRDWYFNKKLLAQIETEYGNYDEAISLYKEQINSRPDSYWSDEPRKALMEIYKTQGNTAAYNDELYNMMVAHTGDSRYYLEYKALFSEEEWRRKWEDLLTEFRDKLPAINLWLSIEGRYDLIMDNAEPDHDYVIDAYGKKLYKLYPQRCLKVLANAADRQAKNSKNRRNYKYIAKTLKKIASRPGGKELAAELAEKYRQQYPRRTAMFDELKRF